MKPQPPPAPPKKILRIINRFNLGGITYNVSYLSRYLPSDFETLLIGGPEEAGEESSLYIPQSLGLNPLIIEELRRSIHPLADYFAYRKIKRIIRAFKPDIVHTHASKAGAIGRLAAVSCKVPVIVHTFHGHVFKGYFSPFKTAVIKQIERYLAKKSTHIVAISEIQKKELTEIHRICPPSKIAVIPLGFDLERFTQEQEEKRRLFRTRYQLLPHELAIGIIGRLAPIKNHLLFIDAIENVLRSSDKPIKALIIGDGEVRQNLIAYLEKKQLSWSDGTEPGASFIFTSWIKEVDVALAGLDLVCLSSKNEGTPVSLIEAQAAGKFVVSTNVGGIQDILEPDCGFLSDANDEAAFKNNLLRAVTDFEQLSEQATRSGYKVLQKFSYQRLCNDMSNLYKGLIEP